MEPGAVSPREREVLALLGQQLTHEEIGHRLFISVRTVESHVASLRRKLDVPDHRALVRYAVVHADAAGSGRLGMRAFAPLTSFVGRGQELSALQAAVRTARVVTAIGPGGVGKTRLVWEAVSGLASEFDDVHWVDLVPLSEPGRLDEAVAKACDAPTSSLLGPVDALVAAFGTRSVLLVLDNAEHLVDAVAVLVERLALACPQLHLLLTSRARLVLPFEQVVRIEGLSAGADGDAVALFVERATAAGSPPPDHVALRRIAAVCSAVGDLPLAVELAAVRMPSLGLDGLERGLVDQSSLLTGGSRLYPRHRSMHETLEWSCALLDEPSVRALHRIAVLVAPFDADGAEAVAAFPPLTAPDVRAALARLAEHNLIGTTAHSGSLRFRMLEPVRQFALAGMDGDDEPAYRQHLRWCLGCVTSLLDSGADDGVAAVADDVRAALAWAAGRPGERIGAALLARTFALLLYRDGDLDEAQQRFEHAASLEPDAVAGAGDLARAAAVAKCRVNGDDALRLELAAAARAEEVGDDRLRARALARAVELLNRFPGMFAHPPPPGAVAEFTASARRLGRDDPLAAATLAVAAAGYASPPGTPPSAAAAVALDAARRIGDAVLESSALDGMMSAALADGDVIRAYLLGQRRLVALPPWRKDPAAGLELKDALHVATFCALGAGDLPGAATAAREQQELPFLRHRRDLADDELAAPAALSGNLDGAIETGRRFLEEWNTAGRPVAAGRGLAPAAVALAHGLRGDQQARDEWLAVLAEIRGVRRADANRKSGYGELFEAIVRLHDDEPLAAFEALAEADGDSLYAWVFRQWIAAVRAEAAVLARTPGVRGLVQVASEVTAGNPIASGITARAAALDRGDQDAFVPLAEAFDRSGAAYQAQRTRVLSRLLR
jgi:predicted ATPase/DNA-binding CsgD family transcriptional regulator